MFIHNSIICRSSNMATEPTESDMCVMTYKDMKHPTQLLQKLADVDLTPNFYDITFIVEGQSFSAHKCIMAASSDYFAVMLAGGFKENKLHTIPIEGIPAVAFELILSYIYSGKIKLDTQTVRDVYEAADMLQFTSITKKCCIFMLRDVNVSSCIDYLVMAKKHSLHDIYYKAENCVFQKFVEVSQMQKFAELPMNLIINFIQGNNLITDENAVLQSICQWIENHAAIDEEQRNGLTDNVRFGLVDKKGIKFLRNNEALLGVENAVQIQENLFGLLYGCKQATFSKEVLVLAKRTHMSCYSRGNK